MFMEQWNTRGRLDKKAEADIWAETSCIGPSKNDTTPWEKLFEAEIGVEKFLLGVLTFVLYLTLYNRICRRVHMVNITWASKHELM